MDTCEQVEQNQAFKAFDLIARRTRPAIVLLNADFSVASAEWDTGSALFAQLGMDSRDAKRLRPSIEARVREIVEDLERDPFAPSLMMDGESIVVRVAILRGGRAPRIALSVEPVRQRENLESAAKRFNFTQRQIDVLEYVLQGLCAREIAGELFISETTVADYLKQLLQKTATRNRAEMVARVLNWRSP